ncbi:MAG: DEAD/DEAH box helicase family protein [Candidatus Helarchaeota archaeon]
MKSLKEKRDYKPCYTNKIDDILNEFLIPTLNLSCSFDYISAYFSAKLFIPLFCGIKTFILENNGKIRLLIGVPLGEELEIINMTREELEKKFNDVYFNEFFNKEKLEPELNDHLKLLAWLLLHNRIKIRWGVPVNEKGIALNLEGVEGILHEKIGIFSDGYNFITFSGSANLTFKAWTCNREEFKVFKSWDSSRIYAELDKKKFYSYWNNLDPLLKVFSFPLSFKEKLIEVYKVESINEINFEKIDQIAIRKINKQLVWSLVHNMNKLSDWIVPAGSILPKIEIDTLWQHQSDAISYLEKNAFNGFLCMATGSGKTRTAIFGSYKLYKKLKLENKKLIIIIGVPDSYLVEQWVDNEIKNYSKNYIKCYSKIKNWKHHVKNVIRKIKFTNTDHFFIVGTYHSLNAEFINENIFKFIDDRIQVLFIGDEAHCLGSREGLSLIRNIKPHYKIGLSATPNRYFDEEGTVGVLSFFTQNSFNIYHFSLKDAQNIGKIMKFKYHIYFCSLDNNEFEQFRRISQRIYQIKNQQHKEDEETEKKYELLLIRRAEILKKSKSKTEAFKNIVLNLLGNNGKNEFWKTVIYVKDKNQRILIDACLKKIHEDNNYNLKWNFIDGDMDTKEREKYIDFLTRKEINAIIAMKCLDRGVDIPSLEKAIFIASSGSELEHIQRAGRILRKNINKIEPVNIFDIIVIPNKEQIRKDPVIAQKIFDIEKKRVEFFANFAENKLELTTQLFNLDIEIFLSRN